MFLRTVYLLEYFIDRRVDIVASRQPNRMRAPDT
jgi:hypothetical protein